MRRFLLLSFLMAFSVMVFAQTRTVTGTILDETGAPVPFASVTEKGTNHGVAADANGTFSINARTGTVLIITAAGFGSREITVGSGSTANITLTKGEGQEIEEVVVTAMGIKRSQKALGYAVSEVPPTSVLQKSEPDLLKGLQGKVPGVDIRTSQGTPGAGTRIQIRGNSSFGLETQPLIVVDGVPYSNETITTSSQTSGGTAYGSGLANLDPNDIESMSVLKGVAASALYGSRASRGVIVITTKSGAAKKGENPININYRTGYSIEKIANLPKYQNSYGTGSQFNYSNSNGSWGPKFGWRDSIPAWPEYLAAYPKLFSATGQTPYRAYPDNVNELFKTGLVSENSIGVNGGNENTSFSLTASNLAHKGYVENSRYDRNNIGVGGQTKYKKLTVGGNLSYVRSKQRGGYFGENQVDGAASQFARSLFLGRNWDLSLPYQDANGKPLTPVGNAQFDNPHWAAYNNVATTIEDRIVAGARAAYKFNNWIEATYNIGVNTKDLTRDEITQEYSRAANGLGRIVNDLYKAQELESVLMLLLNPRISDDVTLDVKLGNNINQRTSRRQVNQGLDFIVPGIYNLVNTATKSFADDSRSKRRIVGNFADVTIGYRNFAFLNATGRYDMTSTLPYKNAKYFYPSLSGSFVFSDAFKLKSDILNYGKVRAGWARAGNDANPHLTEDVFGINSNNFLGLPRTSRSSLVTDPNLTPEFTTEVEAGLDLAMFKRRFNLDFTVYDKKSTNLIYAISLPSSTGYGSFYTNIGEISNKGVEIGATITPVQTDDITWDIRGAFTKNKNMVVSLTEGLDRTALRGVLTGITPYLEPGYPFGYLRGEKVDRDDKGNVLINPATGGMIIALEEGMVGDPNPDFKLGLSTGFRFKGLFMNALFDWTQGGDIYSVTLSSLLGRGVTMDTWDREKSAVIPGVYGDPNTHEPILVNGQTVPNQTRITVNDLYFSPNATTGATFAINTATEMNIYDATVYRLREVTLGYDIPKSVYNKLGVKGATISFSGRNLWHLAPNVPKYSNFDPEVSSFGSSSTQGIELSAAPTTRRFGVNLSVNF